MLVLDDPALNQRLPMATAIEWVRDAIREAFEGRLLSPPRASAQLGDSRLTFTCGRVPGRAVGYRSYLAPGDHGDDQVVVVQDDGGRVRAIHVGQALGPLRTGAIGGVALDALAPARVDSLAVIGSGTQAWQQLVAASCVRTWRQVRVYSPSAEHRVALAARACALGLPATSAASARTAVEGVDVVILATSSPTPVIDTAWVAAASLVTTLGPKQQGRHEFGLDLVAASASVVTDSPDQLFGYDPPNVLVATPQAERVVHLGAVLAGAPVRHPTLFCSVGLAGTEMYLLARLVGL